MKNRAEKKGALIHMNFSYSREIPRRKINENQTRERSRTRFMKIVRCMVCYSVKMWHRHAESACRMCRLCALNKGTNRRSNVKELTEQKIILLIYYHNNFHREIFSMCIYKYLNIYIVSCYCLNWEFGVVSGAQTPPPHVRPVDDIAYKLGG